MSDARDTYAHLAVEVDVTTPWHASIRQCCRIRPLRRPVLFTLSEAMPWILRIDTHRHVHPVAVTGDGLLRSTMNDDGG